MNLAQALEALTGLAPQLGMAEDWMIGRSYYHNKQRNQKSLIEVFGLGVVVIG